MSRRRGGSRVAATERPPVLGVDVGRVISDDDTDTGVSMLSDRWKDTAFVAGCLEAVQRLNASGRFEGHVRILSKCGPKVQERTTTWLHLQDFFGTTGILEEHVYFVRDKADKAALCADLHVTHFVDDRLGNLALMTTVNRRYLFQPFEPPQVPPWVVHVRSWRALEPRLSWD